MKKLFALVLSAALLLSCASAQAMTAGTYTGVGTGMKGEVKVEVVVTDSAIESAKVVEHKETYGIGCGLEAAPVEAIPAFVVANQSLAVDTVSGATLTSRAVVNAIADALTQAGADVEALKANAVEATVADQVLECDVVVAGAGAAGLGAAVAAVEAGADVILLEEAGVTGGSTTRSGGYFIASGTSLQKAMGIEDSNDDFFAFYKEIGGDMINDEKVRDFVDNSAACYEWIVGNGAQFDGVTTVHPTHTALRVHNSLGGAFMGTGQGGQMTAPMTNSFVAKGEKRLELHDDNLMYIYDTSAPVSENCTDAVEWHPAMVVDGKDVVGAGWDGLQPRACIGQSDKYEILMLVIEGRQPLRSVGITLYECVDILLQHGCMQAINLDGGTSAMMWYDGEPVISCSNSNLVQVGGRNLPTAWVYGKAE